MAKRSKPSPVRQRLLSAAVLVSGLGMLAGAVAVTAESALTAIEMTRGSTGITGALSYKLGGVPVYWHSLDGLVRLERRDYEVLEKRQPGSNTTPRRTVQRLFLLDDDDNTLAWSSRTAVLNEGEKLERFLSSGAPSYSFSEAPSGRPGDRLIDIVRGIGISAVLLVAGAFCVTGGLLGLFRKSSAKRQRSSSR